LKSSQIFPQQLAPAVRLLFCLALFAATLHAGDVPDAPAPATMDSHWRLVWSDEFNQPDGSAPNPANWGFDTGGNGWGNNELEYYTSRTNNVRIEDGKLVIEAKREKFGGRGITSGRLLTMGKWSWTYGRFEARIKIPRGQGIWPAFWMLGTNTATAGWPACGEIDIMENIGKEPGTVHGTVHGPGYSGSAGIGGPVKLPDGAAVADAFHIFAVECAPGRITWFLDGKPYFNITPARLPKNTRWVFDQPKFVILNLAIGGGWPGYPDATTTFPQRMEVDYVRVYEKSLPLESRN
jgi:beta-glucanase (GH16 family)